MGWNPSLVGPSLLGWKTNKAQNIRPADWWCATWWLPAVHEHWPGRVGLASESPVETTSQQPLAPSSDALVTSSFLFLAVRPGAPSSVLCSQEGKPLLNKALFRTPSERCERGSYLCSFPLFHTNEQTLDDRTGKTLRMLK